MDASWLFNMIPPETLGTAIVNAAKMSVPAYGAYKQYRNYRNRNRNTTKGSSMRRPHKHNRHGRGQIMYNKLKYAGKYQLDPAADDVSVAHVFDINNLRDVDKTSGGAQTCAEYLHWIGMYAWFQVYKVDYKLTFIPTATAEWNLVGARASASDTTSLAGQNSNYLLTLPGAHTRILGATGQPNTVLQGTIDVVKEFGYRTVAEFMRHAEYHGDASNDPAQLLKLQVFAVSSADTAPINYIVEFVHHIRWTKPANVPT